MQRDIGWCSVDQCDRPAVQKRDLLCAAHYRRFMKFGDVQADVPVQIPQKGPCSVQICDREQASRGWCRGHYHRFITKGDVMADVPLAPRSVTCDVEGCGKEARSKRLCGTHSERMRRTGTTDAPGPRACPPRMDAQGYMQVMVDGKYQLQHRLIWQREHGPLLPGQNIHHKNGDRSDNRLSNLEIWDTTQPAGQRAEDKLAYAYEMIRRYGPENEREGLTPWHRGPGDPGRSS